MMTLINRLHF